LKYHKIPNNAANLMEDIQGEDVSEERVESCAKIHAEESQQMFNTFLDDIITNTHAFMQLKPDLP
jgi:hypothetical protein